MNKFHLGFGLMEKFMDDRKINTAKAVFIFLFARTIFAKNEN